MKILVPTDFSELSKIAVQYAIGLTKDFELEMVLLHVLNPNTPTMARISSQKLVESIKDSADRKMNELVKTIQEESSHNIKISSSFFYDNSIAQGVETFAIKHNIDIICIGTKGATGLKKILFGSNAADIITNSSLPVLTIPEYASYEGINNIIYSCDLEKLEAELKILIPFVKLLNAWVHILHIAKEFENFDRYLKGREKELRTLCSYDRIKTKILDYDSIIAGINHYVTDIEADMVAMFTRETALFDKLFHKSIAKQAVFQAKTPLLTFQKE